MSDALQDAVAQEQSPGAPIPLPVNPASAILGPTAPPVAQPQGNGGTASAQPTQTQTGLDQNPVKERLAAVGHAVTHFAHALEGRQTVYSTDPTTGDVTSQVVPRKPGGFFRDILLGAISGVAAASQPTDHPSGAAGLGLGFQGAQNALQQQQQARKQQAQAKGKEIQQTNARTQQTQQANLAAATVAHDMTSSLDLGHNLNFHNPDELDQYNKSVDEVKRQATNVGGQVAQLGGNLQNGVKGNGPALMAAFNSDPSILSGPEGYHRIPFITHDPGELEHDGQNWKGKADWNSQATVTLVDVPDAMWNKMVTLSKGQANQIAGYQIAKGKPDETVQTTFGSLFALGLKNKQALINDRRELYRAPQNEQEALALKSEADQINSDPNAPDDLKRRAAIKGPLAEKWLAAQVAQKQAMEDTKADKNPPVKTLPEAAVSLATAKTALASNPTDPNAQKAVTQAQAVYDGVVKSKRDELDAEYQSQLRLARGKADAERAAKEQYDRNLYGVLTSGDQTGWAPKPNQFMTESQFNSAKEKFADSALSKAQDTDKSYAMFQHAYQEYQDAGGKLPTGAQSMLALSTHLQTTFGNVKGSRVTKDMIREHLGARSISDDALAGIQKLTSGDVLSPKQWKAFNDLITQSRNQTWKNAVDNAHYRGLPADFLPEDLSVAPNQPSAPQNRPASSNNRTPGSNRNAALNRNTGATPSQPSTFDPTQFPKAQ